MANLRIVTDSSARFLDPKQIDHELVTLAPVTIRIGDHKFEDHPALSLEQHRTAFAELPGQAYADPPTVQQLEQIFAQLQEQTDQIVSLHTSGGISATYRNALRASETFRGRSDIEVIDSTNLSAGLGLLVEGALRAADQGAGLDEVVQVIRSIIPRLYLVFFSDDMTYLERNGLVSKSQETLGNMLGIMPFLTVEHGRLIPMEKVRSRMRAQEKLIEFVTEFAQIDQLGIMHSTPEPDEEALSVAERLQDMYPHTPIRFVDYGPTIATYIGLNGLGVVVLESEDEAL